MAYNPLSLDTLCAALAAVLSGRSPPFLFSAPHPFKGFQTIPLRTMFFFANPF